MKSITSPVYKFTDSKDSVSDIANYERVLNQVDVLEKEFNLLPPGSHERQQNIQQRAVLLGISNIIM